MVARYATVRTAKGAISNFMNRPSGDKQRTGPPAKKITAHCLKGRHQSQCTGRICECECHKSGH